jgi:hypothetical protein
VAQVLAHASRVRDRKRRVEGLTELIPYLPEGERAAVLAEALQAARAIKDEGNRSAALAALAPHLARLPRKDLAALWTETLHLLAARTRADLLGDLHDLAPLLVVLAPPDVGPELPEIARAVADVGRWWPRSPRTPRTITARWGNR